MMIRKALLRTSFILNSALAVKNMALPRSIANLHVSTQGVGFHYPQFAFSTLDKIEGGIDQEAETVDLTTQQINEIIQDFPYIPFPNKIMTLKDKTPEDEQYQKAVKDLLAFKSLNCSQQFLKQIAPVLTPNDQNPELVGKKIFTKYFQTQAEGLSTSFDQGKLSVDQCVRFLVILSNLSNKEQYQRIIEGIDEKKLIMMDQTGLLVTLYIRLLFKYRLDYAHLFNLISQKIESAQISAVDKIKLAKAVLEDSRMESHYSKKIIDQLLNCLQTNFGLLSNYELFIFFRRLYYYRSDAAKELVQKTKKYLIESDPSKNTEIQKYYVILTLKTIKYANKLNLKTEEFISVMQNNFQKFKTIFTNRVHKEIYLEMLTTNKTQIFESVQFQNEFKKFVFRKFEQFKQASEVDDEEVCRFLKLIIKYYRNLTAEESAKIKMIMSNQILSKFSDSKQIIYFSLMLLGRNFDEFRGESTILLQSEKDVLKVVMKKNILELYKSFCTFDQDIDRYVVNKSIGKVINLIYIHLQCEIPFERNQIPNIFAWENQTRSNQLSPQEISLVFFIYLRKVFSKKETKQGLLNIKNNLMNYLRTGKIWSLKIIYSAMDLLAKTEYDDKYIYALVEFGLGEILSKQRNVVVLEKDIMFIKDRVINRGYGSNNLNEFLTKCQKNYRNYDEYVQEYVRNHIQYRKDTQAKRQAFKRQGGNRKQGGQKQSGGYKRQGGYRRQGGDRRQGSYRRQGGQRRQGSDRRQGGDRRSGGDRRQGGDRRSGDYRKPRE